MAKRHLQLKGFPAALIKKLKIVLPEPSDMSAKRKLDLDEQKTRVIQAVQQLQLFPKDEIYREYYDMDDEQIERMKAEMEKEQEENMEKEAEAAAMGIGSAGAAPGGAPPGGGPGYGEAGGQEPAENIPPTANESVISNLELLRDNIVIDKDKKEVLSRIILKQQEKADIITD